MLFASSLWVETLVQDESDPVVCSRVAASATSSASKEKLRYLYDSVIQVPLGTRESGGPAVKQPDQRRPRLICVCAPAGPDR